MKILFCFCSVLCTRLPADLDRREAIGRLTRGRAHRTKHFTILHGKVGGYRQADTWQGSQD
jgi:hypothetical protein